MSPETETVVAALERLLERWDGRSRRLISITRELAMGDPAAAIFASRLASDDWFCWEQPDRGFTLAGLGRAADIVSRGTARFADLAAECDRLADGRLADEPTGLGAGAGPVWTGGFAFAPAGGASAHWSSFEPARLVLPELSLVREGGRTLLTLSVLATAGADREQLLVTAQRRLAGLRDAELPLLDPSPSGPVDVESAADPGAYESAVERAVTEIESGSMRKVVLAREVRVTAPSPHDAAALFGALRDRFQSCFCFCVGTPEAAFVGASPELLIRRRGAGAQTVALAGSTRRSADPALDDHLATRLRESVKDRDEHRIVVERIQRALRPVSVWVEAPPEPELIRVANIQHLATPIHAQIADSRSAVELAGRLHPTPAVGGEPVAAAAAAIERLERMDRGWYSGPVGWMDVTGDGEFCVALRSALLRDRSAHLYAGAGIVAGSDPAAELAETEIKLAALLPLLTG